MNTPPEPKPQFLPVHLPDREARLYVISTQDRALVALCLFSPEQADDCICLDKCPDIDNQPVVLVGAEAPFSMRFALAYNGQLPPITKAEAIRRSRADADLWAAIGTALHNYAVQRWASWNPPVNTPMAHVTPADGVA
jgi:hypothetical protein